MTFTPSEKFGDHRSDVPVSVAIRDTSGRESYQPVVPATTGTPARRHAVMFPTAASGCVNSTATSGIPRERALIPFPPPLSRSPNTAVTVQPFSTAS